MVEVRNETGERVGVCSLLYQDNVANLCMEAMLAEGPKSSDPHNQRRRPTSKSYCTNLITNPLLKFSAARFCMMAIYGLMLLL